MAVTTLLGLPIPSMSETVGKTIPDLATAMQMIDQKLGGVRIVDHNLDVASPPNGYYARWENGLQVCWGLVGIGGGAANTLTFPAQFAGQRPRTVLTAVQTMGRLNVTTSTESGFASVDVVAYEIDNHTIYQGSGGAEWVSVGRWK